MVGGYIGVDICMVGMCVCKIVLLEMVISSIGGYEGGWAGNKNESIDGNVEFDASYDMNGNSCSMNSTRRKW